MNEEEIFINPHLIETIEPTCDTTIITLITGRKIVAKNDIPEIIAKIVAYRKTIVDNDVKDWQTAISCLES